MHSVPTHAIASFLLLAFAAILPTGCASNEETSNDLVTPPVPSRLETSEHIQEMHSEAFRRQF